jgi:hypothetical protein
MLRYSGWGGAARVFLPDGMRSAALAAHCAIELQLADIAAAVRGHAGQRKHRVLHAAATRHSHLAHWSSNWVSRRTGDRNLSRCGSFLRGHAHVAGAQVHSDSGRTRPCQRGLAGNEFRALRCAGASLRSGNQRSCPWASIDLSIGNVPFGNFKSLDTSKSPYADWLIHNWFLGKSVELVRPGGLIAVITSSGSMDSNTDAHRRWLAAHAELVAGIPVAHHGIQAPCEHRGRSPTCWFSAAGSCLTFSAKPHWIRR